MCLLVCCTCFGLGETSCPVLDGEQSNQQEVKQWCVNYKNDIAQKSSTKEKDDSRISHTCIDYIEVGEHALLDVIIRDAVLHVLVIIKSRLICWKNVYPINISRPLVVFDNVATYYSSVCKMSTSNKTTEKKAGLKVHFLGESDCVTTLFS